MTDTALAAAREIVDVLSGEVCGILRAYDQAKTLASLRVPMRRLRSQYKRLEEQIISLIDCGDDPGKP